MFAGDAGFESEGDGDEGYWEGGALVAVLIEGESESVKGALYCVKLTLHTACWLLSAVAPDALHCVVCTVGKNDRVKGDHLLRTSVVKSAENW